MGSVLKVPVTGCMFIQTLSQKKKRFKKPQNIELQQFFMLNKNQMLSAFILQIGLLKMASKFGLDQK